MPISLLKYLCPVILLVLLILSACDEDRNSTDKRTSSDTTTAHQISEVSNVSEASEVAQVQMPDQPSSKKKRPAAGLYESPLSTLDTLLQETLLRELQKKYKDINIRVVNNRIKLGKSLTIKARANDITMRVDAGAGTKALELSFITSHSEYFPTGMDEYLAGIGPDDTTAIRNGISSYTSYIFPAIIQGIEGKHQPNIDIKVKSSSKTTHWYPMLGPIKMEGEFSQKKKIAINTLFKQLKPVITSKLTTADNTIHWMKVYVARRKDEKPMLDCRFDNVYLPEGVAIMKEYVKDWDIKDFGAQRQFIVFRSDGIK